MSNDRVILTGILEKRRQQTAPELSDSKYFEIFCASEILKDYEMSLEEIQFGIVGGSQDGGIDSMYVLLNGDLVREDTDVEPMLQKRNNAIDVHILQAKRTTGFDEISIDKLAVATEQLFDFGRTVEDLRSDYNGEVTEIIGIFRRVFDQALPTNPKICFHYYYATLADEVHPNVRRRTERVKSIVKAHFHGSEVKFDFMGARQLLELTRRESVTTFELEFSENPISTETGSYVCLVPLPYYYKFFVDDEGKIIRRIFDANVRDYQGQVKVNRAIQETLQKPGKEDFWFLNNGVTIVCPRASAKGKRLLIDDPQIVNGLQTSYEIYSHFKSAKHELEESRKILVRVIVEEDPAARDNIVRATNNQTAIPQTSLRAAEKIQHDIEDYLLQHDFFYERRKNYYKNEGKEIAKIISISYLSQAVISMLLLQPDYARARPSTLINQDQKYEEIFNSKYPVPLYLNVIRLMKRVEEQIKHQTDVQSLSREDISNVKFHVAMTVVTALVGRVSEIRAVDIVNIDIDKLNDEFLNEQIAKVVKLYRHLGGNDKVAKGPQFTRSLLTSA